MHSAGTLSEIIIYPIKSVGGFQVPSAEVTWSGLVGDRTTVVVSCSTYKVLTAKLRGAEKLLEVSARPLDSGVVGVSVVGDDWGYWKTRQAATAFSDWLGHEVRLRSVHDFASPPQTNAGFRLRVGVGVDSSPLHLVTTETLDTLRWLYPEGNWDLRRIRPNLVVTTPASASGFVENNWVGRVLRTDSGLRLHVRKPTVRCALLARGQHDMRADGGLLRALVQHNKRNLGVYASVIDPGPGRIEEGEELYLEA